MDLTIETSCCKYPDSSKLIQEWNNNVQSIIHLIEQAHLGIKGTVRIGSPNGQAVANAKIFVKKLDSSSSKLRY